LIFLFPGAKGLKLPVARPEDRRYHGAYDGRSTRGTGGRRDRRIGSLRNRGIHRGRGIRGGDAFRSTLRPDRGRPVRRTQGLLSTTSWPRASAAADRAESSRQHLGAALSRRALDRGRDRSRIAPGGVSPARHRASRPVLRPDEPAGASHLFRERDRRPCRFRRTGLLLPAPPAFRSRAATRSAGSRRRNLRQHGRPRLFDEGGIGNEPEARIRRIFPRRSWHARPRSLSRRSPW